MFIDPMTVMFGKLLLAATLGAIIGTERALVAKQSAGMRTFALVTMGAAAFVIVGAFVDAQSIGLSNFDPMRIAAGEFSPILAGCENGSAGQFFDIVLQGAKNHRVLFHHHHPFRAARGGLEAQCAAAGEQIQAGSPIQRLPQPVEQRLAHAIRGGAQA